MAAMYLGTLRLFSRDVRLFLITSLLIGFCVFGGIYTVLLNLYLLRLGYGPAFVGMVNATGLVGLALFALPAGAVGSRWGCRRTMIVGLSLSMIGNTLLPLAEFVPAAQRPAWLLAMNLLASLGITFYVVNVNPFLMAVTSPRERNHVFSVQAALWPLAGFAGSLVGGLLPEFFGQVLGVELDRPLPYRYPLLIAGLLLGVGVFALSRTRESATVRPAEDSSTGLAPVVLLTLFAIVVFLQVSGEGLVRTFFNVYLDDGLHVPTARIGALAAAGQLVATPAALAMPLLVARFGHARTYLLASVGLVLSLLPLALAQQWGMAGLGFMGVMAAASISRPAIMVYQMELVAPSWRVAIASAATMSVGVSWALMAFGGGYAIPLLGYHSLFLIGAALSASGATLFWLAFLGRRARAVQPPDLPTLRESN